MKPHRPRLYSHGGDLFSTCLPPATGAFAFLTTSCVSVRGGVSGYDSSCRPLQSPATLVPPRPPRGSGITRRPASFSRYPAHFRQTLTQIAARGSRQIDTLISVQCLHCCLLRPFSNASLCRQPPVRRHLLRGLEHARPAATCRQSKSACRALPSLHNQHVVVGGRIVAFHPRTYLTSSDCSAALDLDILVRRVIRMVCARNLGVLHFRRRGHAQDVSKITVCASEGTVADDIGQRTALPSCRATTTWSGGDGRHCSSPEESSADVLFSISHAVLNGCCRARWKERALVNIVFVQPHSCREFVMNHTARYAYRFVF